jgi:hypothetical protein
MAAAKIALVLGLAGLVVSAAGLVIQLMPRHFTAAEQHQIEAWEVTSRWRVLTAGQIFPASVGYQLSARILDSAPLNVDALRVSIAPQSGCAGSVTAAAAAVLRRSGCQAVLRATYVDATRSYIMTVGVAVLPTSAAAAGASQGLSAPARLMAHAVNGGGSAAAGLLAVRFRGAAAGMYDYSRQLAASFSDGPYLIMYTVGYADGRPPVRVSQDSYSEQEMTSLAQGVAQSVASRLAAAPAIPRCPGAPGC